MSDYTYGVRIERSRRADAEYVTVHIMKRENGASSPLNAYSDWHAYGSAPCLDSLILEGFVTEYGSQEFVAFSPVYRNVYAVDAHRAAAMAKTLQRIDRQLAKDEAREHGDVFVSFCKAVGAKWCAVETEHRGTWLKDSDWRFLTIGEARNYLRTEIERARETAISKKAA